MDNVNVHIIKLEHVNTYTINMDEIKLYQVKLQEVNKRLINIYYIKPSILNTYKTFHIKHILNCIYGRFIYILFNTIIYVVICITPYVLK